MLRLLFLISSSSGLGETLVSVLIIVSPTVKGAVRAFGHL